MISIALMTTTSIMPISWVWIIKELRGGTIVVVSIGFVNTFSMVSGLIGPNIASGLRTLTGSYAWVSGVGSVLMFIAFVLVISLKIMSKFGRGDLPMEGEDDTVVSLH